jgi:WD40 repeat protein
VFVTEGPEDSGLIDIRDDTTGERVRSFPGDAIDVNAVAFSPDGSMLATAGDDGSLKVWDPNTGDLLWMFAGRHQVWGPSFSADGSLVAASWSSEGRTRVLDAANGRLVRTFPRPGAYTTFSPDGRLLAISTPTRHDRVRSRNRRQAFRLDGSVNRPGHRMVSGSQRRPTDGTARIWDGKTGEPLVHTCSGTPCMLARPWTGARTDRTVGDRKRGWHRQGLGGVRERGAGADSRSPHRTSAPAWRTRCSLSDGTQVMTSDARPRRHEGLGRNHGGDAEWMNLPR